MIFNFVAQPAKWLRQKGSVVVGRKINTEEPPVQNNKGQFRLRKHKEEARRSATDTHARVIPIALPSNRLVRESPTRRSGIIAYQRRSIFSGHLESASKGADAALVTAHGLKYIPNVENILASCFNRVI